MTDIKIRKWFNNLSNLEKFDVLRDGYAKKITNEYIHLLENKIEKIKEEEEGEEEEIIDDEDLLTQEIILANYDKKYEENDCHYVCIEGYIGIIHRQIKEDEIEHIIRHQTTIPQFKNRVSFFINIYKTNQLKNIFVCGRNILFISISSMTILRPIIKIITDILKYEEERKIENNGLVKFKSLNIEINKIIDKHQDMTYIIENIKEDRDNIIKHIKENCDNIIDEHGDHDNTKEFGNIQKEEISIITGKPKRKYTKKI